MVVNSAIGGSRPFNGFVLQAGERILTGLKRLIQPMPGCGNFFVRHFGSGFQQGPSRFHGG
jgi:hypothetical protein